jgi:hypothetical protein
MTSMRAMKPVMIRSVLFLGIAVCAFRLGALAQSQTSASQDNADASVKSISLADVARQQRATPHPKAKRMVTEEDIPALSAPVSQSEAANTSMATDDKEKKASVEDKEKDRSKPFVEAIEVQKKRIADAQKKIQDLNSERRQRASAQYADMGVLLRDPQKWNQDEKAVQEEIAQKQKEIDDANVKLEETRERARKNGVKLPD